MAATVLIFLFVIVWPSSSHPWICAASRGGSNRAVCPTWSVHQKSSRFIVLVRYIGHLYSLETNQQVALFCKNCKSYIVEKYLLTLRSVFVISPQQTNLWNISSPAVLYMCNMSNLWQTMLTSRFQALSCGHSLPLSLGTGKLPCFAEWNWYVKTKLLSMFGRDTGCTNNWVKGMIIVSVPKLVFFRLG